MDGQAAESRDPSPFGQANASGKSELRIDETAKEVRVTTETGEPLADDLQVIELTEITPRKILGDLRWTGKAKFPGALRGRSIVVFLIEEQLVGISAFCPHEQANLSEAVFVSPWVLECPLHHNHYDLRTGVISTFKVDMRDDKIYLFWNANNRQAVPYNFAQEVPVHKRSEDERVVMLEAEVAALTKAADLRTQQVIETLKQMESMISQVEEKREALGKANTELTSVNEFVNRVKNTMREVLLVLDNQGRIRDSNHRLHDLLGYSEKEINGRGLDMFLSPEDLATFQKQTAEGQQAEFEGNLHDNKGDTFPHLLRSAWLHSPSGKREGVVVVGTDIRQIREARQEIASAYAKVRELLDNMRQAVFVVLPSGKIVHPVSRFSSTVFGCDILEKNVFDVLFKDVSRNTEVFSLLRTAFITTFDADDLQWMLMEEHFPRRILTRTIGHEDYRILKVDYCPLRNESGMMERLMLVVEDITRLENLEKEIEREKQTNSRRIQIVEELAKHSLDELRMFFSTAHSLLEKLREAMRFGRSGTTDLLRALHTLKGNARTMGFRLIGQQAHQTEDAVSIWITGSEDSHSLENRTKEELNVLQRQLGEYSHLAESVLHIENEFEARSLKQLHDRMIALDVCVSAWLGTRVPRTESTDESPFRVIPMQDLSFALQQVEEASAAASSDEVHTRLGEVQTLVGSLLGDVSSASMSAAESAFRRAILHLQTTVLALCTKSQACPPYVLARSRWIDLFVALHSYTRVVLRTSTTTASVHRKKDEVLQSARALDEEYILMLFHGGPALPTPEKLREAWRHVAFLCVLESLAAVRTQDRIEVLTALDSPECSDADLVRKMEQLGSRGGLFVSCLFALNQTGVCPRHALGILADLFGLEGVGQAARLFLTERSLPQLTEFLTEFGKECNPATANGFLSELGSLGTLFSQEDPVPSLYLKKSDVLRQIRSIMAVMSGRYQLFFEPSQLLNVAAYNFFALKQAINRFRVEQTEQGFAEIERRLTHLLDVPIAPVLYKCHDMVTEIAAAEHKRVRFRITGDATLSLPETSLSAVQNAVVQLLRNAVDHGVEHPEVREMQGKPAVADLELECKKDHKAIVLMLRDDGAGIDTKLLIGKAVRAGLMNEQEAASATHEQALSLIFEPGISTAERVSHLSGRGMGMSIVKRDLAHISATITVRSQRGVGTEFVIRIGCLD